MLAWRTVVLKSLLLLQKYCSWFFRKLVVWVWQQMEDPWRDHGRWKTEGGRSRSGTTELPKQPAVFFQRKSLKSTEVRCLWSCHSYHGKTRHHLSRAHALKKPPTSRPSAHGSEPTQACSGCFRREAFLALIWSWFHWFQPNLSSEGTQKIKSSF